MAKDQKQTQKRDKEIAENNGETVGEEKASVNLEEMNTEEITENNGETVGEEQASVNLEEMNTEEITENNGETVGEEQASVNPEEMNTEEITEAIGDPAGQDEDLDDLDIEPHEQEIQDLKSQVEEHLDKALRAQAELDNLRKRSHRDIENAHKFALDRFMKELLPVIDSIELGISATDSAQDIESLKEGMDLTLKKFIDTLEKFGISVVEPMDEKFNPEQHEAVSMQEIEGVESGTVVTVLQKGYELNGRLVRPAMVVVAK